ETLRVLGRRGELTDRLVAGVGAGAAAALTHAHRAGVVHRDVKPENVLVADPSTAGEAKLVDFGIARITGERTLTRTGPGAGAPPAGRGGRAPRVHGAGAARRSASRTRGGRLLPGPAPVRLLLRRAPPAARRSRRHRASHRRAHRSARGGPARAPRAAG